MYRKLFFALLIHTFLFAQITISSKIDTAIATVGDQITLSVSVHYTDENTNITFPKISDELQNFSIIEQKSISPQKNANRYQQDFIFKIAVFDTGQVEVPSLTLAINGQSFADTRTEKHAISVVSILPPDEQVKPKDIKPPFPLPVIIPWDLLLLLLILLALSFLWYIVYKKWKKQKVLIPYDDKYTDPPHIIALRKLKEAATLPFTTEEEIMLAYTHISHILREYLEGRYFIRALEMPTRDIADNLDFVDIENTLQIKTIDLLQKLDIIKFAKQLPVISEKDNMIASAIAIINQTKTDNFLSQRSGLTELKEKLGK
ncbi:MAG: hypothetical protein JXQ65_05430 [Candidatus Marinimicrobia bacterium]|nr:hypothetical protein [Candidatus Neomarinimicrobiota bacterium]